jgi:hypothetical protein
MSRPIASQFNKHGRLSITNELQELNTAQNIAYELLCIKSTYIYRRTGPCQYKRPATHTHTHTHTRTRTHAELLNRVFKNRREQKVFPHWYWQTLSPRLSVTYNCIPSRSTPLPHFTHPPHLTQFSLPCPSICECYYFITISRSGRTFFFVTTGEEYVSWLYWVGWTLLTHFVKVWHYLQCSNVTLQPSKWFNDRTHLQSRMRLHPIKITINLSLFKRSDRLLSCYKPPLRLNGANIPYFLYLGTTKNAHTKKMLYAAMC